MTRLQMQHHDHKSSLPSVMTRLQMQHHDRVANAPQPLRRSLNLIQKHRGSAERYKKYAYYLEKVLEEDKKLTREQRRLMKFGIECCSLKLKKKMTSNERSDSVRNANIIIRANFKSLHN
jgi:hypothetical protein